MVVFFSIFLCCPRGGFFFHKLEAMEAEEAAEAAEIPAGGSEAGQNVFPLSPQRWVSHGRLVWNQYDSMNT